MNWEHFQRYKYCYKTNKIVPNEQYVHASKIEIPPKDMEIILKEEYKNKQIKETKEMGI